MSDVLRQLEDEIPRLRRYAWHLARERDRADDLVQECLLRAVSNLGSWQRGTNMRAWLFTILHNVFLSDVRRRRRFAATTNSFDELADTSIRAVDPDLNVYVAAVQRAFDGLSGEYRETLALVAIEGLTYEEAAGVLNIPIGTVRSRLSRGRSALRRSLLRKSVVVERGKLNSVHPSRRVRAAAGVLPINA